ncbi:MAG: TlpA family protein disulfide reductase [Myxococcota bacterium]
MLRWLATAAIAALLALDVLLPYTALGRRGPEAQQRVDVAGVTVRVGAPAPELVLRTLEGRPLSLADFRGHPLLVTFERSVDW